jgi:8-oxo-dGTP pyrophosphatase MutT (NUDIX family)
MGVTEEAESAARREALWELGVRLHALEFVARVWSSPGVLTTDRVSHGGGVPGEHEDITVIESRDLWTP